MAVLIIAELLNDGSLHPSARALVTAAQKLDAEVDVLVAGENPTAAATSAAALPNVRAVKVASAAAFANALAENVAPLIKEQAAGYSHVLMAATTTGKDVLPRAAALLDVAQVSDVVEVVDAATFVHPVYAGNILETVKVSSSPVLMTVRPTAFDKVAESGGSAAQETVSSAVADSGLTRFVGAEMTVSERPELTAARVVVSGGRGVGSKENFAIIEKLADKLGAAVGASRAAVDAGYVPNDYQVGQTGKVVAPELYVAVGISGAIQHLAGMKDSKVIVAINKDENAPIFEVADYGLVADLFDAVPELESKL